eukprot:CAMPEP_0184980062 /NCGR_PEP_ID=MMETSP1098-20130426/10092_1 /TAXON_ID=89044 /ORGANISM="Spumella elongata, Strain CCAP 955/1" /LENGTH=779 /DNA_ID=CAMNT_0027503419 /DNA_START=421 /DNA_END=2760 /DNA_ORIENTATION=+
MAMFEILYGLQYKPAVRYWTDSMGGMFPPDVSAAASDISHRYDAFRQGKGENPFANTPNHVLLQIEVPYGFVASVPVNPSPYARTFRWIIGFHYSHKHAMYQPSDPTSHCTGANFHLGRGRMCTTSSVVPCPQYDFHRTRSFELTPENRNATKKNIILFDDDQAEVDMERLKADVMKLGGLDDLQVYLNKGRRRIDMPDLYKQVKMTIDCQNPGVEFINYESSLYDTMTLSCDLRATRNVFDFPVPSKYHINPNNWTRLVHLVHDSMVNYEKRIDDFKHFKRLSRSSSQLARTQVDVHYFSRDVMFRTYCGSYEECRRVYPWAVAVWALYPLAMIEVVMGVNLFQESVDNDLMRLSLSELFTSKYFRVYNGVAGVAPVDLFPKAPCAYMVYMDASFIPFGRDFLNTHVAALVKDPRPIVYWQGDKIAIAVMHARSYVKVFREPAGAKAMYIESDFVIRKVANPAAGSEVLRLFGGAPESLEADYLARLPNGAAFTQEDLHELLQRYLPLLQGSCDAATPASASLNSDITSMNSDVAAPTDGSVSSSSPSSSSSLLLRRRRTTVITTTAVNRQPQPRVPPPVPVHHDGVSRSHQSSAGHVHPNPAHTAHPGPAHATPVTASTPATLPVVSVSPGEGSPANANGATLHQQHHHHGHHEGHSMRHRCTPPEHLIIDAIYVPMPMVGENTRDTLSIPVQPTLWLTSSLSPLPFNILLDNFTKAQIETVVQHLDPILQNSNMRKIISIMPTEVADALKHFDAVDFPDVISLRDMEYPQWGETCT